MLDAERTEILVNTIRLGTPLKTACSFAGISDETLRKWRKRGEEAAKIAPGRRNPTDKKYADFVGQIDKALAEANVRAQATIHGLMTKPVATATPEEQRIALSAAQFFLTHRDPDHYSTKTRTELTGADGTPLEVELSAERAWEKLQAILGRENVTQEDDFA